MISSKISILLIASVLAVSSSTYATVIGNGGGVVAGPVPLLGGSPTIVDTSTLGFTGLNTFSNVVFTGHETTTVYSGDTNNGFGGLTFVYNLSNDLTSTDAIDRVSLSGFAGFATDVGFIDPGGTFEPVAVTRSTNGDIIGFDFSALGLGSDDILQGGTSSFLVVRTNAPFDIPDTMTIIDGGSGTASSFGPLPGGGSGTPEPASLGLIGLGSLALLRRRRSR